MKFTRVRVDNFYNLKDVDLDLTEDHALIVGPNGSGKSNIIKCIDFLVDRIVENRPSPSGNIWNVDAPKAKIEVEAVFNKEEVEFFSNLSVFYLLCDLCEIISFTYEIVKSLVNQHFNPQSKHPRPEQLVDELGQIDRFREFPKETLRSLFQSGFLGRIQTHTGMFVVHSGGDSKDISNSLIEPLIREAIEKLFPQLLELTQGAGPTHGYDVFMSVHTADTGNRNNLQSSSYILRNEWSPTSPQKESEVIWKILKTIFGELNGIEVTLESMEINGDAKMEKCTSLQSLISRFVEYWRFHTPSMRYGGQREIRRRFDSYKSWFEKTLQKLPNVMTWFARRLQQHSEVERICSYSEMLCFVDEMARKFLRNSLCILPQNRGLLGRGRAASLDLNKAEERLIQASQSYDDHVHERYRRVIENLKSFCGLDIDVREKPPQKTVRNEAAINESSPENAAGQPKEQAEEQLKSLTSRRQVLATRTIQHDEKSHHKIKTPLSGLSGGELELLMVFCAVHLSGADTVFLDEPGHSLHPPMQAQLRRWLETQRPPGQTCVVVSHSVEFISPQSLRCLYHMSSEGEGFTPFRLRADQQEASNQEAAAELPSPESAAAGAQPSSPFPSHGQQSIQRSDNDQTTEGPTSDEEPTRQASEPSSTLTQTTITMLMRPNMRKMFFATGLYLVEGATDKRVLSALRQILMDKAGVILETSKVTRMVNQAREVQEMDRWDILELGGCSNSVKAYKAAADLKIPCAVVLDFDAITVKHGTQVQPFNRDNWKKSKLCKALGKEQESLPSAKTLLQKITGNESRQAREVLKKHGFFIWEDDLEAAICKNLETRKNRPAVKNFLDIVGVKRPTSSLHDSCKSRHKPVSPEDAKDSYRKKVRETFLPLVEDLRGELDNAEKKLAVDPPRPVTNRILELINQISSKKQKLSEHEKFVNPSIKESDKEREKKFWSQVQQKLHDEGWVRMPGEILLKVLEVCLEDAQSPLDELCRFMKDRQINRMSKGMEKKGKFPQDHVSNDDSDIDFPSWWKKSRRASI